MTPRIAAPARKTLGCGPFKGVLTTSDPLDDAKDGLNYLQDLVNGYLPDPTRGSGAYARPGFALMNAASQLGGANHQGQCVFHHTAADGTEYNFKSVSGKLYRSSADETVETDVTPMGITIDGGLGTRVTMLSFADKLIVSDGVNKPWYGTSLSSTPITGTYIQFDTLNSAWSAQHMTEYSGALVFLIKTYGGVFLQSTIAWSAPNDPTEGYFNTVSGVAVDYTWVLTQTGSTPLYAIWGTNVSLFYWRDDSIGALSGPIGPTFKNNATHDAVDFKIGTRSPASIQQHGNTIFFADTFGRPQMFRLGNPLEDIWKQMRSIVETSRTDVPQATELTACSALLSTLNLWVVALWSPLPAINLSANVLYVFDVRSGVYMGRWVVGPNVGIEALGTLKDQNGEPELIVLGSKVTPASNGFGGFVWRLTNPEEDIWTDNGVLPLISATTQQLGYATDVVYMADQARAILGSLTPTALSILSPSEYVQSFPVDFLMTEAGDFLMTESGDFLMTESLAQATATPSPSLDSTYRCAWGTDAQGRGFELTLTPQSADSQWILHSVELTVTAMAADPVEA